MTTRAPDDINGGLPRNHLQACLLLLIGQGDTHGYELLEQVGDLGWHNVDPGGLYRTLRRLARDGLVESWWEPSRSGPERRTYRLTEEGADWLHAWAGTLQQTRYLLDRYLSRYQEVTGEPIASEDRAATVR